MATSGVIQKEKMKMRSEFQRIYSVEINVGLAGVDRLIGDSEPFRQDETIRKLTFPSDEWEHCGYYQL